MKNTTNTKTIFTKALLTLGLSFGALAAAQTPLTFRSVVHTGGELGATVNETWATLSERGYTGTVTAMTDTSVVYRFVQGDDIVEITLRQTDDGMLIITKGSSSTILASR